MAVMYLGKLVEVADRDEIYLRPVHPYTQALIAAVPVPDPDIERKHSILEGDIPSPANPPKGCNFNTRCRYAKDICHEQDPEFREVKADHFVACHFAEDFL
jgi:oligopeptide/dipeptide ABC transporter ATP-binding protein